MAEGYIQSQLAEAVEELFAMGAEVSCSTVCMRFPLCGVSSGCGG